MPGRSPIPPRRSYRSPSNNKSREPSDSEEEVNVSGHDYNTRYSSPSSGHVSSQDESLQDEDGRHEKSYSRSPLQSESKVRSRVGTRTTSPKIYPDLSDNVSGDGPSHKDAKKVKNESLYPDLPKDKKKVKNESLYPDLPKDNRPKPHAERQVRGEIHEEKQQEESSSYLNFVLYAVLVFLGAFIVIMCWGGSSQTVVDLSHMSVFETYTSGVDQLQKSFPQQSPRLWRTLKSSAKHVLNVTDPEYPVVILMAAPVQNSLVTNCIAKRVASLFHSSLTGYPTSIKTSDINQYKNLQDAKQKETLDKEMTQEFSENGGKSFIILNLQALAPEAALILHGFCDNDNAPYKDVMILMTMHFSRGDLQLKEKQKIGEEDVETYLRNLWGRGLVADKVGALLSRVGNNIVIVAEEANGSVQKVCND